VVLRVLATLVLVLGIARIGSAQEPTVQLVHDEADKEFVVVIGPVDLPAGATPAEEAGQAGMAEMGGHGGHGGHGGAVFPPVTEVSFPFAVYLYGFDYEVFDGEGTRLPTELVHHLNLINPDFRELFLPISQRMLAVGKETGAQSMPRLLMGYPVPGGTRMVVSTMLHNPTGETHAGVRVRVRLKYVKAGRPWPLMNVYPFQMDVAFPAGDKSFDLPPGESTWSYEARPVMPGRIMVIGSHLHENAMSIKFEDVTENRIIWEGRAITDEGDEVVGVTIGHLYRTGGVKITPDHVYRVGRYAVRRRHGRGGRCLQAGERADVAPCTAPERAVPARPGALPAAGARPLRDDRGDASRLDGGCGCRGARPLESPALGVRPGSCRPVLARFAPVGPRPRSSSRSSGAVHPCFIRRAVACRSHLGTRSRLAHGMSRSRTTILAFVAALALLACGSETAPAGPGPTVTWLTLDSEHFIVRANAANTTTTEMEAVRDAAEAHFQAISAFVGSENTPARIINIVLDATGSGSRVNENGSILLGHGSDDRGRFLDALSHELAHAFRYEFWNLFRTWEWPSFGFYEEGFAEFVGMRVDPDKRGFPFFGFPEAVVAGHWVVSGEGVPLGLLRPRNQELNTPCEFQTYPVRASWFSFVDDVYGRPVVLEIAYSEIEVTSAVAQGMLGASLAQLDAAWEQWVSARYAAVPDADALAQAYRQRIAGARICLAGVDF
jgi:hypothetical protein